MTGLPPPVVTEDTYIRRQLQSSRSPRLAITADTTAICVTSDPVVSKALRGYLVQSERSRVRYDAATRKRTCFSFEGAQLRGPLTWDRILFLEAVCARTGIAVDLSRHRAALATTEACTQRTAFATRAARHRHAAD